LRAGEGRTTRRAIEAFRLGLQRAVAAVSSDVLVTHPDRFVLANQPSPLGRDRAFALSLRLFYSLAAVSGRSAQVAVRTVGYSVVFLDRDGRDLIAYQWHPNGRSPVVWPHLHLGSRLLRPELERPFGGAHLPTERVAVTAVLRAAVEDLGVQPLREDWRERFAAADVILRASLA
jgi:hypothetical protein